MLVSSDGTEKANGESWLVVSKTSVNGIYIYSGLQISRNGIGETGRAAWMTHERHSNIVLESKRSKAGERSVPWYSIHGHVCQSHDTLASSTPGSSVICAILFGSERSLTSMDFSPYTIFCLFVSQLNLILLTYLDRYFFLSLRESVGKFSSQHFYKVYIKRKGKRWSKYVRDKVIKTLIYPLFSRFSFLIG